MSPVGHLSNKSLPTGCLQVISLWRTGSHHSAKPYQTNQSALMTPYQLPLYLPLPQVRKSYSLKYSCMSDLLTGILLFNLAIHWLSYLNNYRRKFGSQTSDNMDRWKSRGGKNQGREEWKREDQRRERVRRKKMQAREKVATSRNTMCFQWFVAPKGRKVGSLKRRVRSHVAKWEMKIARHCGAKHVSESNCKKHTRVGPIVEVEISKMCTPMWREAHFQVKMYKAHQGRSTFGSCDVEKVGAAAAQSTFPSQNVQNTPCSEHFWNLRCWKCERSCGAKHISKSKVLKTDRFGALLDAQMWFCVAGARDCAPCQKWAKRDGFLAFPKKMAGVGQLTRIWKDAFSVAGAVQETCSSEMLGGEGADFLRRVAFWSIRSSGLLKWFCVTGAALCMTWHRFFVAGAILQRHGLEKLQNALVRGRQLCIQLSKIEGSLAELLRFGCCQLQKLRKSRRIACCQLQKLRKSRRIASFLMLPNVLQNCFVFKLADVR